MFNTNYGVTDGRRRRDGPSRWLRSQPSARDCQRQLPPRPWARSHPWPSTAPPGPQTDSCRPASTISIRFSRPCSIPWRSAPPLLTFFSMTTMRTSRCGYCVSNLSARAAVSSCELSSTMSSSYKHSDKRVDSRCAGVENMVGSRLVSS